MFYINEDTGMPFVHMLVHRYDDELGYNLHIPVLRDHEWMISIHSGSLQEIKEKYIFGPEIRLSDEDLELIQRLRLPFEWHNEPLEWIRSRVTFYESIKPAKELDL